MSTDNVRGRKFRTSSTLLLGLLVGFVIGVSTYFLGDWMLSGTDSETAFKSRNTSISEDDQMEPNEIFSVDILKSDIAKLSESFRVLEPEELQDLLEISSSHPWTSRLYTIQQILIEYLVQESPEAALAAIAQMSDNRRQALLRVTFANWAQVNLSQALAAVAELSHTDQPIAIDTLMETRRDLSSEEWSSLKNEFNFLSRVEDWEQTLWVYEILDQEPLRAIELLAKDEIDDGLQIDLYRLITEKLVQHDGMDTILQLEEARLSAGVFDELFEQVTSHDRAAALAFFSTVEEGRGDSLGWKLIKSWVADDEEGAFLAIKNMPMSSFRRSMFRSLAHRWAEKDPHTVLDRLMEIPRSVRDNALSTAAGELAIDAPRDLLDRLTTLSVVPGANVARAMGVVIKTWSSDAPKQALAWVQSNTKKDTPTRKELLSNVLPEFALVEPERAMTIAVSEFDSEDTHLSMSLQHKVLGSLLRAEEFDDVIELLPQVHEKVKLYEHREVGLELFRRNRLEDTLKLADSLTDEEKIDYFNSVASGAVIYGRMDDLLRMIASLPSTDLRTGVAEQVLSNEYYLSEFTNDQLETLKSFVSK